MKNGKASGFQRREQCLSGWCYISILTYRITQLSKKAIHKKFIYLRLMTALHNKGMYIMQYVCFFTLIICAYYQIIQNQKSFQDSKRNATHHLNFYYLVTDPHNTSLFKAPVVCLVFSFSYIRYVYTMTLLWVFILHLMQKKCSPTNMIDTSKIVVLVVLKILL